MRTTGSKAVTTVYVTPVHIHGYCTGHVALVNLTSPDLQQRMHTHTCKHVSILTLRPSVRLVEEIVGHVQSGLRARLQGSAEVPGHISTKHTLAFATVVNSRSTTVRNAHLNTKRRHTNTRTNRYWTNVCDLIRTHDTARVMTMFERRHSRHLELHRNFTYCTHLKRSSQPTEVRFFVESYSCTHNRQTHHQ